MNRQEYQKLAQMENYYWWHVGRKFIITGEIKKLALPSGGKILNIGCGTGGTADVLDKFGDVTHIDISDTALEFAKNRGIKNLVKADARALPFADGSFDLIVGLDVLEHMEDDQGAIAEWRRVLKKGGDLFLTVPAYQWLWSEHDEALHHFRRYSAAQMLKLVASMKIRKKSYIIVLAFIPIVLYRLLTRFGKAKEYGEIETSYVILPRVLNNLLIKFLKWEAALLNYVNFPFGTSIIIIASK